MANKVTQKNRVKFHAVNLPRHLEHIVSEALADLSHKKSAAFSCMKGAVLSDKDMPVFYFRLQELVSASHQGSVMFYTHRDDYLNWKTIKKVFNENSAANPFEESYENDEKETTGEYETLREKYQDWKQKMEDET